MSIRRAKRVNKCACAGTTLRIKNEQGMNNNAQVFGKDLNSDANTIIRYYYNNLYIIFLSRFHRHNTTLRVQYIHQHVLHVCFIAHVHNVFSTIASDQFHHH